jgi:pimeloyl-ACP methyl ester carboxylesterase
VKQTMEDLHMLAPCTRPIRAAAKAAIFFLKVLPMLPSGPVGWVTKPPVVTRVAFPTQRGRAEGDLYRPAAGGPHAGVVVCVGVVPAGYDHPQIPRFGEALARAGFAALIYRSPVMADLRLEPEDIGCIELAYQWLVEQPYVDEARSGLIGLCVGGSFALMAAASPAIRDRVAFVGALAPYAAMETLGQDIASSTRPNGVGREHWHVDPLTRKVYVRSLTALLEPNEAELLRNGLSDQEKYIDIHALSANGRAVLTLLTALSADEAQAALQRLPAALQDRLAAMSPMSYLRDIHAPLIILGHDRDDLVIPVAESRRLRSALAGRPGVRYTEFGMFQHMDPTKRKLSPLRLVREFGKFYLWMYPLFRRAVAA